MSQKVRLCDKMWHIVTKCDASSQDLSKKVTWHQTVTTIHWRMPINLIDKRHNRTATCHKMWLHVKMCEKPRCQDFMWFPYPLISQMPPQYLLLIKLMVSIIYWNLSQSDFVGIVGMGNIWRHRTEIAMYLKLKRQQISIPPSPLHNKLWIQGEGRVAEETEEQLSAAR